MNETQITIRGTVGTDPLARTLANGTSVTSFRLASTERRWDREQNQYVDGRSLWITVTCWRQLALNVSASVTKGQRVIVRGRLFESEWETEGVRRSRIELEAETVGHDLMFGTAGYTRQAPASTESRRETIDTELDPFAGLGETFDAPGASVFTEEPSLGGLTSQEVRADDLTDDAVRILGALT